MGNAYLVWLLRIASNVDIDRQIGPLGTNGARKIQILAKIFPVVTSRDALLKILKSTSQILVWLAPKIQPRCHLAGASSYEQMLSGTFKLNSQVI